MLISLRSIYWIFATTQSCRREGSSRSSSELEECSSLPQGVSGSLASFCLLDFNHCSRILMSTQSKGPLGRPQAALVALSTALNVFCAPIPFRSFLSNWTKCSSSRSFATLLPSPPIVVIQD
ncbi:uncharacterized protein LOC122959912 [Acropora millepora]|uniref:uncharacterized protein LOC122959912 n=1 Tax=Acropora millepora TaxID=45264 RepID=UPI001CF404E7|nr:uncharacterized protein LOC122959912 [Acropora millepora]